MKEKCVHGKTKGDDCGLCDLGNGFERAKDDEELVHEVAEKALGLDPDKNLGLESQVRRQRDLEEWAKNWKPTSPTGSAGLTMDRRMIKMTPEEIIKAFKHELRRTLGQQQADKWRVSYDKGWYTLRMIGTSGIKERRAGMMRRLEVLQAYPSF